MTLFGIDFSIGSLWLAAALVLAIMELVAPGFFLIFVAAGAAVTGFVVLLVDLHPIAQALLFALFSGVAVASGRRWYHRSPSTAEANGLNERTTKLIGKTVEVCDAIVGGEGRVTVGDGAWTATGPDLPAGARVRITGAAGSVLLVEPLV